MTTFLTVYLALGVLYTGYCFNEAFKIRRIRKELQIHRAVYAAILLILFYPLIIFFGVLNAIHGKRDSSDDSNGY